MKFLIATIAVTIALISGVAFANPPGLKGKDLPHGLSMQNKTPSGWSKGEKKGWEQNKVGKAQFKHHNKHHKNNQRLLDIDD